MPTYLKGAQPSPPQDLSCVRDIVRDILVSVKAR